MLLLYLHKRCSTRIISANIAFKFFYNWPETITSSTHLWVHLLSPVVDVKILWPEQGEGTDGSDCPPDFIISKHLGILCNLIHRRSCCFELGHPSNRVVNKGCLHWNNGGQYFGSNKFFLIDGVAPPQESRNSFLG